MGCSKWKKHLNYYIDDLLPKDKKAAFESHMTSCSDCNREVSELREVVAMVKTLSQKDLPDDFEIKLRRAIETDELRRTAVVRKRMDYSGIIKWVGAAAAIFLVLFGVLTDRLNFDILRTQPQEEQQRILMEAAPAQEDANLITPSAVPAPEPKPEAVSAPNEKDMAQEMRVFTADIPGIKTNAVDLNADSVQVTVDTLRNIADQHGIEVLDLSCQGITLRVKDGHREILYQELSRFGRIVETGDQTGGDTVSIMILYGFE